MLKMDILFSEILQLIWTACQRGFHSCGSVWWYIIMKIYWSSDRLEDFIKIFLGVLPEFYTEKWVSPMAASKICQNSEFFPTSNKNLILFTKYMPKYT